MKPHPYRWPCWPEPNASPGETVYRPPLDWMHTAYDKLDDLRKKGVTHASFFPDGQLASVTFGPVPGAPDERHEPPTDDQRQSPRPKPTAGLIPRVQRDG